VASSLQKKKSRQAFRPAGAQIRIQEGNGGTPESRKSRTGRKRGVLPAAVMTPAEGKQISVSLLLSTLGC